MKITDIINRLKEIKAEYGDLEVCHYDNMGYTRETIDPEKIIIEDVIKYTPNSRIYYNADERWKIEQEPQACIIKIVRV